MKNKHKINIPLFLAGVLFCLILISFNLTSNLYAKYSTSATGSDSARVAKFDVSTSTDSQSDTIELVPGDSASTGTYTFKITNSSEVVVKNTIIVNNVPKNVQVKFNNSSLVTSSGADITFDVGTLNIGESVDCVLTFSASKLGGSTVKTETVKIQVLTEQMD